MCIKYIMNDEFIMSCFTDLTKVADKINNILMQGGDVLSVEAVA